MSFPSNASILDVLDGKVIRNLKYTKLPNHNMDCFCYLAICLSHALICFFIIFLFLANKLKVKS